MIITVIIQLLVLNVNYLPSFFFLSGFSLQTLTIHRTAGGGRGPSFIPLYHFHPLTIIETFICNFACEMTIIFYSTLPLPPAHDHWDIYLQLCMWDDYHVFLIVTPVFTRLLIDEIYHLIELPFKWMIDDAIFVCLLDELILGFCYSELTLETGGFELVSSITLVLQANRLTKCRNVI